jgi:hypothetical protein
MTQESPRSNPSIGEVISPGPNSEAAVDVAAAAQQKVKATPTQRLEARMELQINELKATRDHLRKDIRWLEGRVSTLAEGLTQLKTSYKWAISFNWFSFVLITIGGCIVSYASFLPASQMATDKNSVISPPLEFNMQKQVATFGLVSLILGVVIQATVSFQGYQSLINLPALPLDESRPSPNPGQS